MSRKIYKIESTIDIEYIVNIDKFIVIEENTETGEKIVLGQFLDRKYAVFFISMLCQQIHERKEFDVKSLAPNEFILEYTSDEGWSWIHYNASKVDFFHSIKTNFGREWDEINGWREL